MIIIFVETKTYSVIDVSKYIINESIKMGAPISNLKLQKILYYIQACALVELNRPLFNEDILKWQFGPVIEESYIEFRKYYNKGIKNAQTLNVVIDEDAKRIINLVIYAKRNDHAFDLVRSTFDEDIVKNTGLNEIIKLSDIKNFFEKNRNRYSNSLKKQTNSILTRTTIFEVAKNFIDREPDMTPKKLQKLCWYAYSWYIFLNNEPNDEKLELLFD